MNKIFRLVWNAALNTWGVASELATAKTKSNSLGAPRDATVAAALGMGLFIWNVATSGRKKVSPVTKLAAAAFLFGTGSLNVAYAGNTCLVNGVWVTAPLASGDKAVACGEGASASQVDDLALGTAARANGAIDADGHIGGAIAIGKNSSAQMYNAVALGEGSSAFGSQSMALGQAAISGVSGNTSIVKSLALGFSAHATEGYTVAIGSGSKATGFSAIGIGNAPFASGANAVALGTWTTASGYNSTGIGNLAIASNSGATAIGDRAKASGVSAIALGTAARAEGTTSISIGARNVVTGSNSGAIGTGLTANFDGVSGNNSYSLGNGNTVSNDSTFVIGNNVTTTQGNSVVLGNNSTDRAIVATPTGIINGTTYSYAGGSPSGVVSVGSVNGERQIINVAAGQVNSSSTDAINGSQLYATNQAISAVDADAVKYDDSTHNTITLGGSTYDNSTHTGGTRITNVADGKAPSDAVNYSQLTETNNSITNLGDNVNNIYNKGTRYFHANSTGTDSSATGTDAIAIGMGAVADENRSVALGDGAKTQVTAGTSGTTIGGNDYTFAGQAPVGTVSVGDVGAERTVTNVAAGRLSDTSTDAVNGSQLNATNKQVTINTTGIATNTKNINGLMDDALQWDPAANGGNGAYNANHGSTGPNKITNVAAADLSASSTDAVNGSQLFSTNNTITNLGSALTNIYETGTKYFHANSTGTDSVASGQDAVAIGMGAVASHDGSVALGAGSVADGSTLGHEAYLVGGAATGEVNIGDRRITGLSAGADDADAVNVEQLKAVAAGAAASVADAVKYDDSTHNTITLGGNTYDNSTHTGGTKITNVADGVGDSDAVNMSQLNQTNTQVTNNTTNINKLTNDALLWDSSLGAFSASHGGTTVNKITNVGAGDLNANSTDAVNGSQLYALGQQVTGIDNRVTNIEGNINSITNGGGIKYFRANSSGADSTASGAESIAMGPNAVASGDGSVASGKGANASGNGSVAMGNGATSSADGSVALGEGASDGGRGAETYTGKYSSASNSTSGTVSIGNAATGESRSLSNVADGKEATDAVNLRQLDGAVAESKKYTDDSISTINTSVANQEARVTNIDNRVTQAVTNVTNLQNGTDGMFQVNNTSKLAKPSATGDDSMAGGAGAKASGKNSSAVGSQAIAAGNNSTAMGNGSNAKADNSVALGANSVADRGNSVSVGAAGRERQITNVAAGTASTDAVNVSQLNSGLSDVTNKANAYTNSVYNSLHKDIKELDDDLSAGVAGAMAMAALPQPYAPGASMTSGSMGTYRGQSAMALGVSRISDNGRWVTKLQATTNTQRDFGASVGVGYQW